MTKEFDERNAEMSRAVCAAMAEELGRSKYACQRKVLDMRKAGDGRFPVLKKERNK